MEVMEMDLDELDMFWRAITPIEAQEALLAMNISGYPHMKKEASREFHRSMHKSARPHLYKFEDAPEASTEDLAQKLGGMLRG